MIAVVASVTLNANLVRDQTLINVLPASLVFSNSMERAIPNAPTSTTQTKNVTNVYLVRWAASLAILLHVILAKKVTH